MNQKQHWEQIYTDKDPLDVSWHQNEPVSSMRLIDHSGIQKDEAVIDIGSGTSMLVDRLHEMGFERLAVLDISGKALSVVKKRLRGSEEFIEWHEADILKFRPPHRYSLWHDRAVFHFLTRAADRQQYVKVLKSALGPGGQVVLAAFAIGGPGKCSGLDIVQYDAPKILNELGKEFELVEEHTEVHMTPTEKQQKFSYFRIVKK